MTDEVRLEVFHQAGQHPPFIVAVAGRITTDGLAEIERQLVAEAGLLFTAGDGTYLCRPSWEAPGTGDPADPGGWAVEGAELIDPSVHDAAAPRELLRFEVNGETVAIDAGGALWEPIGGRWILTATHYSEREARRVLAARYAALREAAVKLLRAGEALKLSDEALYIAEIDLRVELGMPIPDTPENEVAYHASKEPRP